MLMWITMYFTKLSKLIIIDSIAMQTYCLCQGTDCLATTVHATVAARTGESTKT